AQTTGAAMIATWMLYAAAVGGLVTVAASAIDRALAVRGRPTRFVWLAALVVTIGRPLVHVLQQWLPKSPQATTVMPFTIALQPVVASVSGPDRATVIDRGLIAVWIALSAILVFRLARGVRRLRRTQEAWRVGDVDGTRVRLSENVGPAVVGLS